ncbi:MAG: leucine--tRNA ligase [Candidatus Moranbacteria bacterium]|nr:leucine--tRNA ligase [Candidatus Moranbacteria bacterium]
MEQYKSREIEAKWQGYWEAHPELCQANDSSDKPKKYILDMFPYPSAAGLHVGHVESYTATDIVSRYWRAKGFNVLHPQGWDAFGLPAENYAIKTGVHPDFVTHENIKNFTRQIKSLGMSYDWSREIDTSSPEYYKWTQWFFLFLYENGLAYKKKAKVNWCESCQTVLANEQAEGGICERCKNPVVQKDLEQWFFKITDFIEQNKNTAGLLEGLDKLDWPESIKAAQRNWIGKSEGSEIDFKIVGSNLKIKVFTTRIDTIFGCTYCVVAPEHKTIQELKGRIENWPEVEGYIEKTKSKTDLDRMEAKEKTGVEVKGVKVVNPFNDEEVPLFIADYVLAQYGTGAVMAVPAHDERDFEFAKKYDLPIKKVVSPERIPMGKDCFTDDGILINSQEFDGLKSEEAREKMTKWLEEKGLGKKVINYRLRDWLVSRQRYWGAPIPIIYCEKCGEVAVPKEDLPVVLPTDVDFKPTGESPLANSKSFHEVKCPKCGGEARRESDTMDTFVCSSWYYFRYADHVNDEEFAAKEKIQKWLPVDLYVGGAEHAVLHLLYARFFTKALHNLGYIDFDEPFLKLRNQGMIMAEDGRKMSKSLGNVVNPDDAVAGFGADSLRIFEMFMGPLEDAKPWNTQGIVGVRRFLERIWRLQEKITDEESKGVRALVHKTIKKAGEDIEMMKFNTAISAMMILVNEAEKNGIAKDSYGSFVKILAPFAPHIAEEIWEKLGNAESIFASAWPDYDSGLIKDEEINLVVQVNGKMRDMLKVGADIGQDGAKAAALESEKIRVHVAGKEIRKIIFVPGKLLNIVV